MKERHIFRKILFVIALFVFCFAAFKIIAGQLAYKEGRDEYEHIREIAEKEPEAPADPGSGIDWSALRQINPDLIGWIRFKEPAVINYPVVQGKDNKVYLKKSFGKNFVKAGTIFMNYANDPRFNDSNTIIYGHNMNDGSMFASLKKYKDKAFWESYPEFVIYTPDDVAHTYKIFAAGTYLAKSNAAGQYQFTGEEDFLNLISEIKAGSAYDTGIDITAEDRIVTLYTCTNVRASHRWLVFGVDIRQ